LLPARHKRPGPAFAYHRSLRWGELPSGAFVNGLRAEAEVINFHLAGCSLRLCFVVWLLAPFTASENAATRSKASTKIPNSSWKFTWILFC
jgi:hypothetical protein